MRFNEEPEGDPHGECAEEIHKLRAEVQEIHQAWNDLPVERVRLLEKLKTTELQIKKIYKLFHRWDDSHIDDACFSATMAALLNKINDLRGGDGRYPRNKIG